jgi:hypothetical protein
VIQPSSRRFAILRPLLAAVVLAVLVLAPATHQHSPLNARERCATCAATLHSPLAIQSPVAPVLGDTITLLPAAGERADLPAIFRPIHGSRSPPG